MVLCTSGPTTAPGDRVRGMNQGRPLRLTTSVDLTSFLLGSFRTPIAILQRALALGTSDGGAAPDPPPPKPPADDEDGGNGGTAKLARHVAEREGLIRHAKLAVIVVGVLLVLDVEYIPMVAADLQLEDQYGAQVRSLVQVEGFVTRLEDIVAERSDAWEGRVNEQFDTAMRRIVALDAYDQLLTAGARETPARPAFLDACARGDRDVALWIETSAALRMQWPTVVERCVIEPMGADFDRDGHEKLMPLLRDVQEDVDRAIVQARQEFPLPVTAVVPASVNATLPPPSEQIEPIVHKALIDIEGAVDAMIRFVEVGPAAAIVPLPEEWLAQFAGPESSLRSFRDNLLLNYASPYGRAASSLNQDARLAVRPLEVSLDGGRDLSVALNGVRASQAQLQKNIAAQTADLNSAIPDYFKPVLIVAKPKHLVLFYPLLVAAVGAYFLVTFTRIQRDAWQLRWAGANGLPWHFFITLAAVPTVLLLGLFPAYDWPQFVHGWWLWADRGPLLLFGIVVFGCVRSLRSAHGMVEPAVVPRVHGNAAEQHPDSENLTASRRSPR